MVLPDETWKKAIQGTGRPKGVIKCPRDLIHLQKTPIIINIFNLEVS